MSNSSQSGGDHINHYQRLVKRMTRFWVDTGYERTEQYLKSLMAKMGIAIVRKARGIVSSTYNLITYQLSLL